MSLDNVEIFFVSSTEAAQNLADWYTNHHRDLRDPEAPPIAEGWYYWFCFPGCLPDSSAFGPFASEDEAYADAELTFGDDDETDSPTPFRDPNALTFRSNRTGETFSMFDLDVLIWAALSTEPPIDGFYHNWPLYIGTLLVQGHSWEVIAHVADIYSDNLNWAHMVPIINYLAPRFSVVD